MKKLMALAVVALFFLVSCSSSEHKLIGTWKVSNVETNFKASNLPKSLVEHIKDEQKQLSFKIVNDSVLVMILDNNTHEAKWKMDSKTKIITYYFDNLNTSINKLGKLEGNEIVSETNTPLGKLTVTFEKQ